MGERWSLIYRFGQKAGQAKFETTAWLQDHCDMGIVLVLSRKVFSNPVNVFLIAYLPTFRCQNYFQSCLYEERYRMQNLCSYVILDTFVEQEYPLATSSSFITLIFPSLRCHLPSIANSSWPRSSLQRFHRRISEISISVSQSACVKNRHWAYHAE